MSNNNSSRDPVIFINCSQACPCNPNGLFPSRHCPTHWRPENIEITPWLWGILAAMVSAPIAIGVAAVESIRRLAK